MQKALKMATIAIVALAFLIFLSNILMNRIFYNPYRDYETDSKIFNLSVQTLMPNYSHAYIAVYEPGTPKSFSQFSQAIKISQISAKRDINDNAKIQGKMSYSFGKATYVKNKEDSSKNVFLQNDFSPEREIKEISIKEDSYYMAHIAVRSSLSTEEIMQKFPPIFTGDTGDLVRIIVKTSEDKNAVAMGMDCQSSFFVFGQGGYVNTVSPNQMEIIFKNNLRFLKENEKTLKLYLNSGFFGDIEINIEKRISYLNDHGIENLGVVVFARGDTLEKLLQNPKVFLTFLDEDV